jgi:hypothetical protein
MTRRFYASHRRAWTPRFWPNALLSTAVVLSTLTFASLTPLEGVAAGFGVGVVFGVGRWELWKWMHPVIPPAEYISDLRRNAHLN